MYPTGVGILGDPAVADGVMDEVTQYANKTSFMRRQSGMPALARSFTLSNGGTVHVVETEYMRLVTVDVRAVTESEAETVVSEDEASTLSVLAYIPYGFSLPMMGIDSFIYPEGSVVTYFGTQGSFGDPTDAGISGAPSESPITPARAVQVAGTVTERRWGLREGDAYVFGEFPKYWVREFASPPDSDRAVVSAGNLVFYGGNCIAAGHSPVHVPPFLVGGRIAIVRVTEDIILVPSSARVALTREETESGWVLSSGDTVSDGIVIPLDGIDWARVSGGCVSQSGRKFALFGFGYLAEAAFAEDGLSVSVSVIEDLPDRVSVTGGTGSSAARSVAVPDPLDTFLGTGQVWASSSSSGVNNFSGTVQADKLVAAAYRNDELIPIRLRKTLTESCSVTSGVINKATSVYTSEPGFLPPDPYPAALTVWDGATFVAYTASTSYIDWGNHLITSRGQGGTAQATESGGSYSVSETHELVWDTGSFVLYEGELDDTAEYRNWGVSTTRKVLISEGPPRIYDTIVTTDGALTHTGTRLNHAISRSPYLLDLHNNVVMYEEFEQTINRITSGTTANVTTTTTVREVVSIAGTSHTITHGPYEANSVTAAAIPSSNDQISISIETYETPLKCVMQGMTPRIAYKHGGAELIAANFDEVFIHSAGVNVALDGKFTSAGAMDWLNSLGMPESDFMTSATCFRV